MAAGSPVRQTSFPAGCNLTQAHFASLTQQQNKCTCTRAGAAGELASPRQGHCMRWRAARASDASSEGTSDAHAVFIPFNCKLPL